MTSFRPASALLVAALLAGCGIGGQPHLYPVPAIEPATRIGSAFRTVEIRQVSLPVYAEAAEMAVQTPEGSIQTRADQLWADLPARSATLELGRALGQITRATVAPEPWPFEAEASARVEVRVEEMLADSANTFRLRGQFFVTSTDGSEFSRARLFDLSAPIGPEITPAAMAAARAQVMVDLAELIARRGLR